jgi:hypothetical protein
VKRAGKIAFAIVGFAVGVALVVLLREATLSTHEEVAPASQVELVLSAHAKRPEHGQTLAELVEAQLATCKLQTKSEIVEPLAPQGDDTHFRAVLAPAMDDTDTRQFRGCLQDWFIDRVSVRVVSLEAVN